MDPIPQPTTSYGFPSVSPLAGGAAAAAGSQGDIPYAQPGPRNTMYGYTDQPNISAGYQAKIPLVGWSLGAPRANTGLAGLNQAAGYATQGGMNYYSLSAALQSWGQMTPDQRVTVQKQLLASGMYTSPDLYGSGTAGPKRSPLYGAVADPETIQALQNAWSAANDTGQTLDSVLSQHNAAARNAAQIYQQNTQVGIFDQSSPSELRSIADQQAIAVLGRKATADEKLLLVSMEQGKQIAYQQGQFNQRVGALRGDKAVELAGGIGGQIGGVAGGQIAGGATPASVNALVSALGGQESGSPTAGGYDAVNPDSGAFGRFGFMPNSYTAWAREAGVDPNDRGPHNQEIVALYEITKLLADGNGDPGYVAVAWYAGEGTAKAFQADPSNPKWQKPQGKYPSIASYAQSIAGKMAATVPGTLATQSMAGQVGNLPADGSGGPGNAGSINVGQGITSGISAGGAGGGSVPLSSGQSSAGGSVPFGPGLNAQGQSTLPAPQVTSVPTGTVTGGQPTPAQLLPTSTGIYTQVNTGTDMAEYLRNQNPQAAGAQELANALAAVRQMFHG